jgi:ribosomal protein L37AE/L43A
MSEGSVEPGAGRGARAASPFHCPYCGETDLWPREPRGWECRSCLRSFAVEFLGQGSPTRTPGGGAS